MYSGEEMIDEHGEVRLSHKWQWSSSDALSLRHSQLCQVSAGQNVQGELRPHAGRQGSARVSAKRDDVAVVVDGRTKIAETWAQTAGTMVRVRQRQRTETVGVYTQPVIYHRHYPLPSSPLPSTFCPLPSTLYLLPSTLCLYHTSRQAGPVTPVQVSPSAPPLKVFILRTSAACAL